MIRIYCGKPGSGKSAEIKNDIEHLIADPDNTVMVIHGCLDSDKSIGVEADNVVEKFGFSVQDIRSLTDAAVALKSTNSNSICYLFIDHGVVIDHEIKDALAAADVAGVRVTLTAQHFSEIKNYAPELFANRCECYIVHKNKHPRLASSEDIRNYA